MVDLRSISSIAGLTALVFLAQPVGGQEPFEQPEASLPATGKASRVARVQQSHHGQLVTKRPEIR